MPSILLFLSILKITDDSVQNKHISSMIWCSAYAVVFVIYLISVSFIFKGRAEINKLQESHVIHHWHFKNADFNTTMEPTLFQETLDLVNKYEPGNGIFLISKYDSLLCILLNKYNLFSTVNIALDLISKKNTDFYLQKLTKFKPTYIFVDTGIDRNHYNEIYSDYDILAGYDSNHSLPSLSKGRVAMLNNLKNLYKKALTNYVVVEQGKLITVYRLKESTV